MQTFIPAGGMRYVTVLPASSAGCSSNPRPQATTARSRPPVKRCLFSTGTSAHTQTSTPAHSLNGSVKAPILIRHDVPKPSRRRTREFKNKYGAEPAVFLKVGDRNMFDYTISVGQRDGAEVMASELCDVARQPVHVRTTRARISGVAFEDAELSSGRARAQQPPEQTSGGDGSVTQDSAPADAQHTDAGATDCSGLITPAAEGLKISAVESLTNVLADDCPPMSSSSCGGVQHHPPVRSAAPAIRCVPPTSSSTCGGDFNHLAYIRRPAATQKGQASLSGPDGDGCSSLMWLLDFRLDGLMTPTGDDHAEGGASQQTPAHQLLPASPPSRCRPHKRRRVPCKPGGLPAGAGHCEAARAAYNWGTAPAPVDPLHLEELIALALAESGTLTVSGIYHWITSHFAFYKACDERWRNSIRHNLSLSRRFEKCGKAGGGGGHRWRLAAAHQPAAHHAYSSASKQPVLGYDLADGDDAGLPTNDIWLSSAAAADLQRDQLAIGAIGGATHHLFHYAPDESAPMVPAAFSLEEAADRILSGTNHQVEVQFISARAGADPMPPDTPLDDYQSLGAA